MVIMKKTSILILTILVISSVAVNFGLSAGIELGDSVCDESTMSVEEGSSDVPTWRVGTSWTYRQETWINSTAGSVNWVHLEERITYTVLSVEYIDVGGVTTPVYRVTKDGEVLGGNGEVQAMFGPAAFEIEEGDYEGHILYRMDDLGVLEEHQYRNMIGTVQLLIDNFELTMSRTITHEPNVEDYDFPLTPERHFLANNMVHTEGFNHVIAGWSVDDNSTANETTQLNRTVHVSEDIVPVTVSAETFHTFEVSEYMGGDDEGTKVRYYNGNIQNYVKEDVDHSDVDWYKTLEDYEIPDDPNSLSIEPAQAYVGDTVAVRGSFPGYPSSMFDLNIPMAGFVDAVETDAEGNFSLNIQVPEAEDNTPSPGLLGRLGVVARSQEFQESYQAATLTILNEPDHVLIAPAEEAVIPGDFVVYSAVVYDAQGNPVVDVTDVSNWSIDDEAGGDWDANVYTSENQGTWMVTANYSYGEGILTGVAELIVTVPDYIEIDPQLEHLFSGESVAYSAAVFDADDIEIDDITEEVVWSIDEDAGGDWVANVYTSENHGEWTVTANYTYGAEYLLDTAELEVVELGFFAIEPAAGKVMTKESISYTAKLYDILGHEIKDVTDDTSWSIDAEAGGSWDNNVYVSEYAGEWTVTATYNFQEEELIDTATLMVELMSDVPTWIIGSSWTYYQESWSSSEQNGVLLELDIDERLIYTVASIEYVEVEGVTTPVYNVTVEGEVLGGEGEVQIPIIGSFDISVDDGYTEGYILHRIDDLGVLKEYEYQHIEAIAHFPLIDDEEMNVTSETTNTHLPNVEDHDFPLKPSTHFWANNSVHSQGYYHMESNVFDQTQDIDETDNFIRRTQIAPDLEVSDVPAGEFETFKIEQDETINGVDGYRIRNYCSNVQNYVEGQVDRPDMAWTRVLEQYNLPPNPNTLSVDPSEAFVGDTVAISGAFINHTSEEFDISIPMADIHESVTTGSSGNFSIEIYVPHAEDNTPSPGILGSLGVIAQLGGSDEPYDVSTLTILDYPDYMEIEPKTKTVISGDTVTYTATAYNEAGDELKDITHLVNWSVDTEAGGTWYQSSYSSENTGVWNVTGVFSYGGDDFMDEVELKVTVPDHIRVEPVDENIVSGDSIAFTAIAYDEFDEKIREVSEETVWSVEDGANGSWVDNIYTSETPGTWNVTGNYTYQGRDMVHTVELTVSVPDRIEVTPAEKIVTAGDSVVYTATAYDDLGNEISDVTEDTVWEIDGAAGGSWDQITGTYTSEVAGEWSVTGTYTYDGEGLTDNAALEVEPGEPAYISVTPGFSFVSAGETQNYTAVTYDMLDNEIDDVSESAAWSIDGAAGGSWNGTIYTSEYAGTWDVEGGYLGLTDTATLMVSTGDISTVEISPSENQTITAGEELEFTAEARDEHGNVVTTSFSWENATAGTFNKVVAGDYNVTATALSGVTSEPTRVTVKPRDEVDSVVISPSENQSVVAGIDLVFNAEARDVYGNVITDDPNNFTWQGADNGIFNEEIIGSYNVTAAYDGVTSSVTSITVVPSGIHSVEISPDTHQIIDAGDTIDFSASAYDEFGNLLEDNATEFEWEDTDETGFFNHTAVGEYNVSATYDIVTSEITRVTVLPADVYRVEISPDINQTTTAGVDLVFEAEAYDTYDNLITHDALDFTWHGTDETGIFNREEVGDYYVNARYETVNSTTVLVTVVPSEVDLVEISPTDDQTITVGNTIDFSAAVYDEYGNMITDVDTDFAWENTDAEGLFQETTAGEYGVRATYSGISSNVTTVNVMPGVADHVNITPAEDLTLAAGEEIQFSAAVYDEYGNLITDVDTDFAWENTDAEGLFQEITAGEYGVRAAYSGISSNVTTVNVVPGVADHVNITPAEDLTLAAGEEIQFSAAVHDEYDNLITDDVDHFAWENADSNGLFSQTEIGEYHVNARYLGISSPSVTVTVIPAETAAVIISPTEDQVVTPGEELVFSSEARDEYGNLITDMATEFTWQNAEDGVFNRETAGEYEVRASYDGVTSDPTIVTVIEEAMFTLTINTVGEGSTEPPEETHVYGEGVQVTIEAVPDDGWYFSHWTGDHEGTELEITVTMDGDKTVTAVFVEIPTYTLTVNIEGEGTVDIAPDLDEYEEGTIVTLTAVPVDGWELVGWIGDDTGADTEITVTMDGDRNITAVFEEEVPVDTYGLTVNIDGEGNVEADPDLDDYEEGTSVTLTATPASGWVFVEWTGDYTGADHNITVTMDGDREITALFQEEDDGPSEAGMSMWILPLVIVVLVVLLLVLFLMKKKDTSKGVPDEEEQLEDELTEDEPEEEL
ncbi:MAG: hypothetical protein R6U17_05335 [Thermoplasmata archaeon]